MLLVRGEEADEAAGGAAPSGSRSDARVAQEVIFAARSEIHATHMAPAVEQYIVALIEATRYPERYDKDLRKWIQYRGEPARNDRAGQVLAGVCVAARAGLCASG